MLSLRLSSELETRLANMAKRLGMTKSALAREALVTRFDDLEDLALAELALREDDGTRYSLAEVEIEALNNPQQGNAA